MKAKLIFIYLTTILIYIECSTLVEERHENQSNGTKKNQTKSSSDANHNQDTDDEKIPDPLALIIPGYNLPGHLFNDGKPFYVGKDPITGAMDFNSKTPAGKDVGVSEYDYIDEEPSTNIFDKSNIDRKDGGFGSHRPNDINQLSPNFHDFLNLPVKYNPDKYVYPLISSSYANTKIQGNVNNYNHKQYSVTTYRPTVSPMYYTTKVSSHVKPNEGAKTTKYVTVATTTRPTTTTKTTSKPTTTKATSKTTTTQPPTKPDNLMNSPMNIPSYLTTAETDYDYDFFTTKNPVKSQDKFITEATEKPTRATYKPTSSTTEKPYSIFDALFGDYEEPKPDRLPSLFENVPPKTEKVTTASTAAPSQNSKTPAPSSEYEYDYYNSEETADNTRPEDKRNVTAAEPEPVVKINSTTVPNQHSNFHQNFVKESTTYQVSSSSDKNVNKTETIKVGPAGVYNRTEQPQSAITSTTAAENYDYYVDDSEYKSTSTKPTVHMTRYTSETPPSLRVTSLPLGENHPTNGRRPIMTFNNLKEQLYSEKVESVTKPFLPIFNKTNKHNVPPAPSTSNIRIAPDQDMVSFVVGNHQNVGDGHYVGTAVKENTFSSNSFRPIYTDSQSYHGSNKKDAVSYSTQINTNYNISVYPEVSSSINVQPIRGSEASVSIGHEIKTVPGQVVDEKLDLDGNKNIEYPSEPGSKIVFPEDDPTTRAPPKPTQNREILSLYSKPMYHQLPAELTPPIEQQHPIPSPQPPIIQNIQPVPNIQGIQGPKPVRGNGRPPWDPRPGHFYQGRPEYARPPRPNKPDVYKRIDGLPNILPQFRPNAKVSNGHYPDNIPINNGYMQRQPLLDRPSNRPIEFFEKLQPPPPPPKRLHDLRKVTALEAENKHPFKNDEKPQQPPPQQGPTNFKLQPERFGYQTPPKVNIANRRNGDDNAEIATLQMIQTKQSDKIEKIKPNVPPPFKINYKETTDKPLYVVYPVNSAPLKLDVLDSDKKEAVVVGTRGEQPLPPSEINQQYGNFDKPLLKVKNRNDSPILKPQLRPAIKTNFPYPIERPDQIVLVSPVPETPANNLDNSETLPSYSNKEKLINGYQSSNQWTSLDAESRIINGNNGNNRIKYTNDQISATLKTYTETPIAIAYTPTEPQQYILPEDKFSMPNYDAPVIPEIRPEYNKENSHHHGVVGNAGSEFTVSAVMHTHMKPKDQNIYQKPKDEHLPPSRLIGSPYRHQPNLENHKLENDQSYAPVKLDFQAPFQASVSIGSENQGWSVVRDNIKSDIDRSDTDVTSTIVPETSSAFDIENFKPQLFGGFKPIYNFPEEEDKADADSKDSEKKE